MSYVLRFPFRPQSTITKIEDTPSFEIGALTARFCDRAPYVIFEIRGFPTESAAAGFVPAVWGALRWVLIDRGLNSTCEVRVQGITRSENPQAAGRNLRKTFGLLAGDAEPVHGLGDEGWPAIYDESENHKFMAMGEVKGTVSTPADLFLIPFRDAICWPEIAMLVEEPRFRLATDLFSAYHFERSASARLVTLGMMLEVLAEPVEKHSEALLLLERWGQELVMRKNELAGDEDAMHALESLERELVVRREASRRSCIRRTSAQLGSVYGEDAAKRLARDALETYDARSTLVHNGMLAEPRLSDAVETGRETARQLLRAYVLTRRSLKQAFIQR